MTHGRSRHYDGRGPEAALASVRNALCRLSWTHPWLWLVRPGAVEATAPLGLVLLDGLPRLLDALGAGALGHG
ncbi:hypothetical protein [Thalassospira sp.]|uniref:hypothetical protein n=1 Tax=Thalassospira sp. TaxID=1912094 RepID=UPI001B1D7F14|nr:hypothetical protein [Thalassospira sp.]MBO6805896.1 hypothetical protein [Thalassospira sp.]